MKALMLATLLTATQENPCAPDCPTNRMHAQSLDHTHGGKCRGCSAQIDVCFAWCDACAKAKGVCPGCGGRRLKIGGPWTNGKCGVKESSTLRLTDAASFRREWTRLGLGEETPKIDFEKSMVIVLLRGEVHDSARTRLQSLVEFDDRVELTYAYTTPKCGNEQTWTECVFVVVPRATGKFVVRALDERSDGGMHDVATFDPIK